MRASSLIRSGRVITACFIADEEGDWAASGSRGATARRIALAVVMFLRITSRTASTVTLSWPSCQQS